MKKPVLSYKLLDDKFETKNKEKKKIFSLYERNKENINHYKPIDNNIVFGNKL